MLMIAYANFYRTILCKQKNTSLRKSNFIPWMIETPKGVNVSLVLLFLNYINVEKICSMCQNWSIYSEATDGYIFYSADEAKYITF